jgi:DNA polymerase-1
MGFCNTLHELLQKEKPTHLAVAFDHGKTFRHDVFPEYKAQREETPEDIRRSIPIIKDILTAYNIPILQVDGFEADDVIGTIAGIGERNGMDVFMLTPDKDYAQLVTDHIKMYRPRHGGGYDIMGPKEVCEKYGIENTSQVIDLLGLMGDSSDNFPGCPGVGEKTAVKLINEFGSIEGLLSRTSELKGKIREKIEGSVEDIKMSKYLATIRTDIPIEISLDSMTVKSPDEEKLSDIFAELEFKTFANRVLSKTKEKQKTVNTQLDLFGEFTNEDPKVSKTPQIFDFKSNSRDYITIENEEDIEKLRGQLATSETFSFNVEGSEGSTINAEITSLCFAINSEESFRISLPFKNESTDNTLKKFSEIFENDNQEKIVQNAKYAITLLRRQGIEVRGKLFDTTIAQYLINPELRHDRDEPINVSLLLKQKEKLEQDLRRVGAEKLFYEVEMPLVHVLVEMEMNGVLLDTKALAEVSQHLNARLEYTEQEIYELAGETFNISSPRQVGDILFGKMQIIDKPKKTKTGQYITSEEVLQTLRTKNPIISKILNYRGLKKLLGTYVDALPKLVNPRTGHIHTSFNQTITATGRLSSSDPNLQNIPIRTDDGREIRRCFIPEPGELFFSADYSQVELRIMASLSGDEHMIAAFLSGQDIHAATSAKIYHKDINEVTKDERRKAKSANFGIIYGISAFGLAQGLDIDRKEAKELIDGYFESFPQVMAFIEKCKENARTKGYAETLMGRRRYLPDINSKNGTVRAFAERNAVNAPIQGTAADIMKVAMVRIYKRLKQERLKTKMILQVHDELNFSVPENEREQVQKIVIEEMQGAYQIAVPLIADCGWGANWLEAH